MTESPDGEAPRQNIAGMTDDMPEEGVGADNQWTAPYTVSSYTVADPEEVVIRRGQVEPDGRRRGQVPSSPASQRALTITVVYSINLEFIDKADFEMPGDSNGDNIYEVTVVASDGEEQATQAVTVKITDSDEAGIVTLSNENPVAGTALTATLEDSDGDVINVGWAWYALTDDSGRK